MENLMMVCHYSVFLFLFLFFELLSDNYFWDWVISQLCLFSVFQCLSSSKSISLYAPLLQRRPVEPETGIIKSIDVGRREIRPVLS